MHPFSLLWSPRSTKEAIIRLWSRNITLLSVVDSLSDSPYHSFFHPYLHHGGRVISHSRHSRGLYSPFRYGTLLLGYLRVFCLIFSQITILALWSRVQVYQLSVRGFPYLLYFPIRRNTQLFKRVLSRGNVLFFHCSTILHLFD